MGKLKADGTPRKKYVSKKMRLARIRKNGQKKAWETRKALYPETNGFKPKPPAGLEIIKEIVDKVVEIGPQPEPEDEYTAITKEEVEAEEQELEEVSYGIRQRQRQGEIIADLEKKLEAADAVNRNLKGMMQKFQVEGAENRIKIEALEEKLRKNEEAYFNLQTKKEANRSNEPKETLIRLSQEKQELITALQHDLKLADKVIQAGKNRAEALEGADRKVADLAHENALLLGELRGANYCFEKLSSALTKGGTHG